MSSTEDTKGGHHMAHDIEKHAEHIHETICALTDALKSPSKLQAAAEAVKHAQAALAKTDELLRRAGHQQVNTDPAIRSQRDREKSALDQCYAAQQKELTKYLAAQESIESLVDAVHEAVSDFDEEVD